ncbi:MAG: hypothetical protein R2854_13540 [Caldilineaceae bacterium]
MRSAGYDPAVFGDDVSYAVSVAAAAPGNVILDPSFEEEPSAWDEVSLQGYGLIYAARICLPRRRRTAHALSGSAASTMKSRMCARKSAVPAAAYLHYYRWMASEDACGYDFGGVGVNGYWLMEYTLCTATNTGGWERFPRICAPMPARPFCWISWATDGEGISNLLVDNLWFASGPSRGRRRHRRRHNRRRPGRVDRQR